MPTGDWNYPIPTYRFNDALGWLPIDTTLTKPGLNFSAYFNPHECDSAMFGSDICPVCGERRSIEHSSTWDDALNKRVEHHFYGRCSCCKDA